MIFQTQRRKESQFQKRTYIDGLSRCDEITHFLENCLCTFALMGSFLFFSLVFISRHRLSLFAKENYIVT